MTTPKLPPAAVFTHDETLHRILLPPLATFLNALQAPDQLVKLNDILTRFRTPKSYHRIDVRIVESSDLPPHDTDELEGIEPSETNDQIETEGEEAVEKAEDIIQAVPSPAHSVSEERKARWQMERGEPIILPDGMSREEYLEQNSARAETEPSVSEDGASAGNDQKETTTSVETSRPQEMPSASAASTSGQDQPQTEKDTPQPLEAAEAVAAEEEVPQPSEPTPAYPLPPTGPTRRIRELRLDLRTLDAAALFALETWRRELLGLKKLPMEHPDSIWYKEPTPSPPPVTPVSSGKRRGRPPKIRRSSSVADVNEDDVGVDETTDIAQESQKVEEDGDATEAGDAVAGTDAANIEVDADGDVSMESPNHLVRAKDSETITGDDTIATEDALRAQSSSSLTQPAIRQRTPPVEEEGEDEIDLNPDRELSPDIIVYDLHDSREDADPDFVPPPEPTMPIQKAFRTRQDGEPSSRGKRGRRRGGARATLYTGREVRFRIDLSPTKTDLSMEQPQLEGIESSSNFAKLDEPEVVDLTMDYPKSKPVSTKHAQPKPVPVATPGFRPFEFVNITPDTYQKPSPIKPNRSPIKTPVKSIIKPTNLTPASFPQSFVQGIKRRRTFIESVTIPIIKRKSAGPRNNVHFRAFAPKDSSDFMLSDEDDLEMRPSPKRQHAVAFRGNNKAIPKIPSAPSIQSISILSSSPVPITISPKKAYTPVPQRVPDEDDEWGFLM